MILVTKVTCAYCGTAGYGEVTVGKTQIQGDKILRELDGPKLPQNWRFVDKAPQCYDCFSDAIKVHPQKSVPRG